MTFAGLGLILAAWLLRAPLEATMLRHMLLQWPMLLLGGVLLAAPRRSPLTSLNWKGVPGLLLASTALFVWMLPLMLDRAVDEVAVDVAKTASLVAAGAIARWSWADAPLPSRLFFAGNALWMTASVGVILQSATSQLCASYLQQDQVWTGIGLVVAAVVLAVAGGLPMLRRLGESETLAPSSS